MDTDKIVSGVGDLIKNPLLFLGIIGLGLCLVAALGRWPGSESEPIELAWRLALGIIGLVVAGFSLSLLVRDVLRASGAASKSGFDIEGKYYAEGDSRYVNEINRLSDNVYRIKSHSWEGVGFVENKVYYGIYKYTDNPDCAVAGNWGAHRAEKGIIEELPVFVIELSDKFHEIGDRYTWKKASS